MTDSNIICRIKTAGINQVFNHLLICKDNFMPSLDTTVDIAAYSKKIIDNAITFEAWGNKNLAGLVAAYCNDTDKKVLL